VVRTSCFASRRVGLKSGYLDGGVGSRKKIDNRYKHVVPQRVVLPQIVAVQRTVVRFGRDGKIEKHSLANRVHGSKHLAQEVMQFADLAFVELYASKAKSFNKIFVLEKRRLRAGHRIVERAPIPGVHFERLSSAISQPDAHGKPG